MGEVINLNKRRSHVAVYIEENRRIVIPESYLVHVVEGRLCITDIPRWEEIFPAIVRDWLSQGELDETTTNNKTI